MGGGAPSEMSSSFDNLMGGQYHMPTMATMTQMMDFDSKVSKHLRDVYATLCFTILAAAAGSYCHLQTHVGGAFTGIAGMLLAMYLMSTAGNNGFDMTRFGLLLGFGFLKGLSLGGLIEHALYIDPSLVVTALLATTVVFGCFSACAMFAKRRSYLYLGGILGSVMFYMAIASLANLFLGWHIIQEVQIYLGLLVFSGYVVFDTQVIIEKASQGQTDVVKHSLELFIDFAAIFVRILIILMRNKESDDRRKRNRN